MRKWLAVFCLVLLTAFEGMEAKAAEPENKGAEVLSQVEDSLADQYDFDEIDGSLKELFPGEKHCWESCPGIWNFP